MMTTRLRSAAFFVAMSVIAPLTIVIGCGKFGTGENNTSSSSGGTSGGLDPDGGRATDGNAPLTPDVLPPPDGSAVCSPMPSICNGAVKTIRFDNTILPNDWDASAGLLTLQDEAFCSPRALRAEVTIPSAKPAIARHRFFNGRLSKAHVRYALRGPAHQQTAGIKFGCLLYFTSDNPAEQTSLFRFEIEPTGVLQVDAKTEGSFLTHDGDGFVIPSTTTANDWRIVDVLVDILPTQIDVSGTFEGKPFSIFVKTTVHPTTNELHCGIEEADGPNGSYVVYVDDVQIETCPL